MSIELENLEAENVKLLAHNTWLANVNDKMAVMLKNAGDVLTTYADSLRLMQTQIQESAQIYEKLHTNLIEVFNEQSPSYKPDP